MSYRLPKVQQQIKRLLSEFLLKERDALGIGIVSINDILVSRDLNTAKVLVSFIAEPNQQKAFQKLIRNAGKIQTYLYKNFPVRKVPKVIWQFDAEPAAGYRIEQILDDIQSTTRSDRDISGTGSDGESSSDSIAS